MTSEEKQKELRKIENAYSWISYIAFMKECEYDDERYHSKKELHEELERIYKHLDVRVVLWALDYYKEEIKRKKVDNRGVK